MSTSRLELDFEDDRKRELPYFHVARIYVKMPSRVEENSLVYITPDCASESEFDEKINGLIEELVQIRVEAHRKFKGYYAGPNISGD